MSCHVLLLSTDSQVPMCGEEEGTWGQGCRVCEVSRKTFLSSLFYLNVVIMHYFFCRGGSRLDYPFGSCSLGCSRCGFDYSCGQLLLFLENVSELLEINGRLKTYRLRGVGGEGGGLVLRKARLNFLDQSQNILKQNQWMQIEITLLPVLNFKCFFNYRLKKRERGY